MSVFKFVVFTALMYLFLATALVSGFGVSTSTNNFQGEVAGAVTYKYETTGQTIIDLINKNRISKNIQPLGIDQSLVNVAESRAYDMVENLYYAHKTPDGDDYTSLLKDSKSFSCEDLDLSARSQQVSVYNDWLESLSHRECMLDPRATSVGFTSIEYADYGNNQEKSYLSVLILTN